MPSFSTPASAALALALVLGGGAPHVLAGGVSASVGVTVHAGALSVTAPAALQLPSVRLSGSPVSVEADLGPIEVVDTRAGSPGWTLVALADPFLGPLEVLMRGELEVAVGEGRGGLASGAAGALSQPRALAVAHAGSGRGAATLVRRLRLTVPPDTPSGRFTARLTLTIT